MNPYDVCMAPETYPKTAGFRFLGGPLHHMTRPMPADPETRDPIQPTHTVPRATGGTITYKAIRIVSGDKVWWIYLADGETRTRGELIDTYPYLV